MDTISPPARKLATSFMKGGMEINPPSFGRAQDTSFMKGGMIIKT